MIIALERLQFADKAPSHKIMSTTGGPGETTKKKRSSNDNADPEATGSAQSGSNDTQKSGNTKRRWKKARGSPKQPLSAYNLFYQSERGKILEEKRKSGGVSPQGTTGFAPMTRRIAEKWNNTDEGTRAHFEMLASHDKARYNREKREWKEKMVSSPEKQNIGIDSGMRAVVAKQMALETSLSVPSVASFPLYRSDLDHWRTGIDPLTPGIGKSPANPNAANLSGGTGEMFDARNAAFVSFGASSTASGSLMAALSSAIGGFDANEEAVRSQYNASNTALYAGFGRDDDYEYCSTCQKDVTTCTCPLPITNRDQPPSIAELASSLDSDSINFLLRILD